MLHFLTTNFRLFLIMLFVSLTALHSQSDPAISHNASGTNSIIENYDPLTKVDTRIQVNNINFTRRYSPTGLGEFLDINFNVINHTNNPINMIAFVLAFHETNAVDHDSRHMVPYPKWRAYDPESETFLIHTMTITPKDYTDDQIWQKEDPNCSAYIAIYKKNDPNEEKLKSAACKDYIDYQVLLKRLSNRVGNLNPISSVRPPFWKYLHYITSHPNEGLQFILYGDEGPADLNKRRQSNYIPPTEEEIKKRSHKTLSQHKYTLEHINRKTMFNSHHYLKYGSKFKFFNKVAIILFDADLIKAKEEQAKRELAPGENIIEPIVYRQVFVLHERLLKIR